MTILKTLLHEETGAALTEYAMLLALAAVAVLGAVSVLRDQIITVFNHSSSNLSATQ